MKISVDDVKLFELSATQKKVIKNDIQEEVFDEDMKRRLQYILMHKYERCFERLKNEWLPKLKTRTTMIPTDDDALANMIFSQPDYKSRSQKEMESLAEKNAKQSTV